MSHEEETANFLGDPVNDYCAQCFCSYFYVDDDCACECHEVNEGDYEDAL